MTDMDWMAADKEQLPEAAVSVDATELPNLVALLSEKNNTVRYQAFLMLQCRSRVMPDVYPFWDTFRAKLNSDNSYQRSIGIMLIAENTRWDTRDHILQTIDAYLNCLTDEKPITVRQCIQSLALIYPYKPVLNDLIVSRLMAIDLMQVKETMRKLILMDALQVLLDIRKNHPSDELDSYLMNALSGGILDDKQKKQLKAAL